jgi:hypothetical protein
MATIDDIKNTYAYVKNLISSWLSIKIRVFNGFKIIRLSLAKVKKNK